MKEIVFSCTLLVFCVVGFGQKYTSEIVTLPLYDTAGISYSDLPDPEERTEDPLYGLLARKVTKPTITVFFPNNKDAKRTAVLICPGGGYHTLLMEREGYEVAKEFNKYGITAAVVKYRLPGVENEEIRAVAPIRDALRAMHVLKEKSTAWNIDTARMGIMGFSAGGHLAASVGVHYNDPAVNESNDGLRPDFMILINPVVSFTDSIGHAGSRNNLLGKNPTTDAIRYFSNELNVTRNTPQSLLIHNNTDNVVPVENSLEFFNALRRNQVKCEIHIYSKGEHGFMTWPTFEEWMGRCVNWLKGMGYVK